VSEHTPEPWRQHEASKSLKARSRLRVIVDSDYEYIIGELFQFGDADRREANAHRIVACVNACAGIPTELLEWPATRVTTWKAERDALREQVRELQAYLGTALHWMRQIDGDEAKWARESMAARLLAQTAETEAMTDPSVMACGCLQDERCDYHKAFRIAELRAMGVIPNDK